MRPSDIEGAVGALDRLGGEFWKALAAKDLEEAGALRREIENYREQLNWRIRTP